METNKAKVKAIIEQAKYDTKGSYTIYNQYKQRLADLNLSPEEYSTAIRKLANALRV